MIAVSPSSIRLNPMALTNEELVGEALQPIRDKVGQREYAER
jgi:hypothetical protein